MILERENQELRAKSEVGCELHMDLGVNSAVMV
jgi:hypothetical protein